MLRFMVQEYIEGILVRGEQDRKELTEDRGRGTENKEKEDNNEDRSTGS